MTLKQFADEEIDRLIESQIASDPELADLARFLTELRSEHIIEPSPAEVERLARSTAAVVRSRLAPVRPSLRSQRPRSRLTALRTYSTTATAMLALVVFSGLGLAANASVPGDFLYGLDLAMERVGIGAGSLEERFSEAEVLADFADARGYGDLKKRVAAVVVEALRPLQSRYADLMADPAELDRLLARGAAQAAAVSMPKLAEMKRIMGLTLP